MKGFNRVTLFLMSVISVISIFVSCGHDNEPESNEFPVPQDMRRFMYALNITNEGVYGMPKAVATPKVYGWILPVPVDFGKTTLNIRYSKETVQPLYLSYRKAGKTENVDFPESGRMECDGSITMEVVDEEEFILELPAVTHGVEYNGVSDLLIMLKAKPDEVRVDGLRTDVDESKFPEEIPLVILPGGWKDGASEYSIPSLYPIK